METPPTPLPRGARVPPLDAIPSLKVPALLLGSGGPVPPALRSGCAAADPGTSPAPNPGSPEDARSAPVRVRRTVPGSLRPAQEAARTERHLVGASGHIMPRLAAFRSREHVAVQGATRMEHQLPGSISLREASRAQVLSSGWQRSTEPRSMSPHTKPRTSAASREAEMGYHCFKSVIVLPAGLPNVSEQVEGTAVRLLFSHMRRKLRACWQHLQHTLVATSGSWVGIAILMCCRVCFKAVAGAQSDPARVIGLQAPVGIRWAQQG